MGFWWLFNRCYSFLFFFPLNKKKTHPYQKNKYSPNPAPAADASAHSTGKVHGYAVSNAGGSWQLDWQALENAVHDFNSGKQVAGSNRATVNSGPKQQRRVCALLLCSPHNPTGHTFSLAELRQLGEFCAQHDLILCSDEIHAGSLLPQTPHFMVSFV